MEETVDPIIEVENLVVKYGDRTVLDGVSFTVRRGEVFVILGGSGSGKTTLIRNLVGLMRPFSGCIRVKGEDFTRMSDDERIEMRKKIGMCFQSAALFNSMTVGENVALALREHTDLEPSTVEIMTKIKLELVGLAGCEDLMPSELSGGMRKRAGIARAMSMDPDMMFYDEPSAGLDPIVAAGIDALADALEARNNGVLLLPGQDALTCEHGGMGDGALDVVGIEPPVEVHRGGKCLDEGIRGLVETPRPGLVGPSLVAHRKSQW